MNGREALMALIIAVGMLVAGWTIRGWQKDAEIADLRKDYARKLADAAEAARVKQSKWDKEKLDAELNAKEQEKKRMADAAATTRTVASLREQLAASRRAVSSASVETIRRYADTLADVLGECADSYRGLAEEADGHVIDKQRLMQAWPD